MLAAGFVSIVLGLLLARSRARFARVGAAAATAWLTTRALIVVGGLLVLRASPLAALGVAMILAAIGARGAWVRSPTSVAQRLARSARAHAITVPNATEEERLCRAVAQRHPRWSPEVIERLVRDHRDPEAIARILIRMEREGAS